MTALLPSGQAHIALLPATTLTAATASAPALRLVGGTEPNYAYNLGAWVFVPTQYAYPTFGDAQVVRREPRRITRRWQRGGQNWYACHGHAWVFHEDELSIHKHVIDFSYHRRAQAVAAA